MEALEEPELLRLILKETWTSEPSFMANHLILVEIFEFIGRVSIWDSETKQQNRKSKVVI